MGGYRALDVPETVHRGMPSSTLADWCREPGTAGGFVVTSDLGGLCERMLDRKADVVRPLADTDYGAREFAIRDPEANLWCFGEYAGQPVSA